jgi:hypothetical protein
MKRKQPIVKITVYDVKNPRKRFRTRFTDVESKGYDSITVRELIMPLLEDLYYNDQDVTCPDP